MVTASMGVMNSLLKKLTVLEYLDRLDVDRMGKLTLLKGKTLPVVSATCMARRRRGAQRWRRRFGAADR